MLEWVEGHMGEWEARAEPFRFEVFSNLKGTELRVIRRYPAASSVMVPMQDFSIWVADFDAGKELAEKLLALIQTYEA